MLTTDAVAHEDEAVVGGPGLGLPVALEDGPCRRAVASDGGPPAAFLCREALEGHVDRGFDTVEVGQVEDLVVEEGAVQGGLEADRGTGVAQRVEAAHHEVVGPVAVMGAARPVVRGTPSGRWCRTRVVSYLCWG